MFGVDPQVRAGNSRVWELAATDLPSAFDLFTGRRLFLGSGDIGSTEGDVFLTGPPGSTDLRLRSIASLLRAEASHVVGLQDLGAIDFDSLGEAPEDGYVDAEDSSGVRVEQGHVYVLSVVRPSVGAPNYAKLVVDAVGSSGAGPDRQFVDFRYAVQLQPGNRGLDEEG
ncbi:MAG: hypothetical protein H0V09_07500 [Gemmatimonadetes bacterium]|nr:hypothetical protein [Gemmatimonadota bacterium]